MTPALRAAVLLECRRRFVARFGARGADASIANLDMRTAFELWKRTNVSGRKAQKALARLKSARDNAAAALRSLDGDPPSFYRAELAYLVRRLTAPPVAAVSGHPSEAQPEEPTRATFMRDHLGPLLSAASVQTPRDLGTETLAALTLLAGFEPKSLRVLKADGERGRVRRVEAVIAAERAAVRGALDTLDRWAAQQIVV